VTVWTVATAVPTPTVPIMLTTTLAGAQSVFENPLGALLILLAVVVGGVGFIWLLVRLERGLPPTTHRIPHNTRARLNDRLTTSEEDTDDED